MKYLRNGLKSGFLKKIWFFLNSHSPARNVESYCIKIDQSLRNKKFKSVFNFIKHISHSLFSFETFARAHPTSKYHRNSQRPKANSQRQHQRPTHHQPKGPEQLQPIPRAQDHHIQCASSPTPRPQQHTHTASHPLQHQANSHHKHHQELQQPAHVQRRE